MRSLRGTRASYSANRTMLKPGNFFFQLVEVVNIETPSFFQPYLASKPQAARLMAPGQILYTIHLEEGPKHVDIKVFIAQSCSTLCDPMACSLPGSSVHGILQARILEWVAIPFSRGSSQPRDRSQVFCTAGRFFTI